MSELSAEERNAIEWGQFWRTAAGFAIGAVLLVGTFIGVLGGIAAMAMVADGRIGLWPW